MLYSSGIQLSTRDQSRMTSYGRMRALCSTPKQKSVNGVPGEQRKVLCAGIRQMPLDIFTVCLMAFCDLDEHGSHSLALLTTGGQYLMPTGVLGKKVPAFFAMVNSAKGAALYSVLPLTRFCSIQRL